MSKPISRSKALIAAMYGAALKALAASPTGEMTKRDIFAAIEAAVALDEWAREVYPHNGNVRWRSIFNFASVGLVKARYITSGGGTLSITPEGRSIVAMPYDGVALLASVHERYQAWKASQVPDAALRHSDASSSDEVDVLESPDERMSSVLQQAHQTLAAELIETIRQCEPAFFEQLVVKLLLKMGYGGSREEAGRAVGQSGDGGIDGIINEDRLGLDAIYLQAKRWSSSVGEGEIRDFKGALDAKGAHKGVFITTSYFTASAIAAAKTSRSYRIVLIDGERLAELMIEHGLGVAVTASYELKRLDLDYFNNG